MKGSTFKRCGCKTPQLDRDGQPALTADDKPKYRQLGSECPRLRRPNGAWSRDHGTWYFAVHLAAIPGAPVQRIRQGGLPNHSEAQQLLGETIRLIRLADEADDPGAARTTLVAMVNEALKTRQPLPQYDTTRRKILIGQPLDDTLTVEAWLTEWLQAKIDLRPSTARSYASHVRLYLIPHLGRYRLDRLRAGHVQAMFTAIDESNELTVANNDARHALQEAAKTAWRSGEPLAARAARERLAELPPFRRPAWASTKRGIRATLRSALTDAVAQQLVTLNVAKLVKLPSGKRPKALVWTNQRVAAWRKTRTKPSPVMVWTAAQTAAFLDRSRRHEQLWAMFHLIAFTGLRRGEACGLRWVDRDLPAGTMAVREQIVQLGWQTTTGRPKSDAGERIVALDKATVAVLAAHRRLQQKARLAHGPGWMDTGLVFTDTDGAPLHPAWVTQQFVLLAREADLPPIRLHDLRHGAATHALSAGVDVKVVSEMLGHSSSTITRDTYTSVVDDVKHAAAAALASVFRQAGKRP